MPASFFSLFHQLEVEAKAYLQANLGEVLEVVQAHVAIDRGLYADVLVEVEAVTNFGCQEEIVSFEVWANVVVLEATTEEQAVLNHVVACSGTQSEDIIAIHMRPSKLTKHHPTVGNEITACSI